jgi:hypothetical protein
VVELSDDPDVSDDIGDEETDGLGDDDSEFVVVIDGSGVDDAIGVFEGLSALEAEAESL